MSWFQRLLIITIAATFVLVVIGGTVRATDSGLGCPDWPTCHGKLVPSADKHTIIEYSHRTAAFVVGLLFLGVTFFTFKTERRNKLVFWLAFSAGLLLAAQIILGGITVKKELPPEIVAAHLGTAMAFIGVLIVTATVSLMRAREHGVFTGALEHDVHARGAGDGGGGVSDARAGLVYQRHRRIACVQRLAAVQRQPGAGRDERGGAALPAPAAGGAARGDAAGADLPGDRGAAGNSRR